MGYEAVISQLLIVIAAFVVIVNIVTEVAKGFIKFDNVANLNLFVTIFSIILTAGGLVAYFQIKNIPVAWYTICAFLIIGVMVAYAAMYGYDKLISQIKRITESGK